MTQEINENTAYLMALRRAVGDSSATPHQPDHPESAPSASPDERFRGAEKRRSSRYRCEGSVEVREEGCDVRTWAAFTDISMHGCYVEAQATYPPGTILHMKLAANGVRVETPGVVRVTYPYLGMGIAFEGISEENKGHLKQLLATVSRRSVITGPAVSSRPTSGSLEAVPQISDASAAIQSLIHFFESHQQMMRDDFLRIVNRSQQE